jgi:hypothetical protein
MYVITIFNINDACIPHLTLETATCAHEHELRADVGRVTTLACLSRSPRGASQKK